jgi:hypothetical protein
MTVLVEKCSHGNGKLSQLLVWRDGEWLFTEHVYNDEWTRSTAQEARRVC